MAGVGVVTAGGMVVGRVGARSPVIPVATMVSGGALVAGPLTARLAMARLVVVGSGKALGGGAALERGVPGGQPLTQFSIVGLSMDTPGLARSVVVGRLALGSRVTAAAAGRRFLFNHHGEGNKDSA